MSDTLVLDAQEVPIYTTLVKDAMRLYLQGKADIVSEDTVKMVRSEDFEMGMPRVIKLRNWVAARLTKTSVPFCRRNLVIRDSVIFDGKIYLVCQYCGEFINSENYSMDHLLPRSRGGKTEWANIVVACTHCNFRKANRTPVEAGMKLLKKPSEPWAQDPRFNFKLHIRNPHPSWKSWLYWNVELEK